MLPHRFLCRQLVASSSAAAVLLGEQLIEQPERTSQQAQPQRELGGLQQGGPAPQSHRSGHGGQQEYDKEEKERVFGQILPAGFLPQTNNEPSHYNTRVNLIRPHSAISLAQLASRVKGGWWWSLHSFVSRQACTKRQGMKKSGRRQEAQS